MKTSKTTNQSEGLFTYVFEVKFHDQNKVILQLILGF